MRETPSPARGGARRSSPRLQIAALFAALGAVVGVAHCSALVTFKDCTSDRECNVNAGERCNLQRSYCEVPTQELCNGADDDRDGVPDESESFGPCELPLPAGMRGCRDGVLRCQGGRTLACSRRTAPAPMETCDNGVDDDCDGIVDNSAACQQNYSPSMGVTIGSDDPGAGEGDDAPAHPVCIDQFSIDRHEVTFEAFARFLSTLDQRTLRIARPAHPLNASVTYGRYIILDDNGTELPLALVPDQPDALTIDRTAYGFAPHDPRSRTLPAVNITWNGANRYCRWAGKHLPSEAEFFRAARGADGLRPFPWGADPVTCQRANVGIGGADGGPCNPGLVPVGSLPMGANPEGVFELYGNANEWMWDFHNTNIDHTQNNYYRSLAPTADAWCGAYPQGPLGPDAGAPIALANDAGLYCAECRFARGRHYRTVDLRIGIRRWLDADRAEPFVGFRCSLGGADR